MIQNFLTLSLKLLEALLLFILPAKVSAQASSVPKPNPTITHYVSSVGRSFNYSSLGWGFDFDESNGVVYIWNQMPLSHSFDWIIDCRQDLNPPASGVFCWPGSNPTGTENIDSNEIVAVRVGPQCYSYQIDIHTVNGVTYGYVVNYTSSCSSSSFTPTVPPTSTPPPSPTPTSTPTPTPTPTPEPWMQVYGGDVYQNKVNMGNSVPSQSSSTLFLNDIPGQENSSGVVQSPNLLPFSLNQLSLPRWFVQSQGANLYDFDSYWVNLNKISQKGTGRIGNPSSITSNNNVIFYQGNQTLDTSFASLLNGQMIIYLLDGDLTINNNFSIGSSDAAVFIVNGNIDITPGVTKIAGLFMAKGLYTIESELGNNLNPLELDGMIIANTLNFNRKYSDGMIPTYTIKYQPQYAVRLLPLLGQESIRWEEIDP